MIRVLALSLMVGCGASEPESAPASSEKAPVVEPSPSIPIGYPPKTTLPASAVGGREGVVRETMDGGGYTYARLEGCGTETWVAGPKASLAIGDTAKVVGNMPMHGFHSKTFDRTFDSIIFVSSIATKSGPPDCSNNSQPAAGHGAAEDHAGHDHAAPAGTPNASPHGGKGTEMAKTNGTRQGTVVETMESGGYRYAHVDFCGTKTWVAAPGVTLEVGQTIDTDAGMAMNGFHSKTLDRTFPSIDFVRGMRVVPGPPACK